MNTAEFIKKIIREKGSILFVEFMHLALYHPEWGYYTSCLPKLGQGGDFITAPEISSLFGMALAEQILQIAAHFTDWDILEFGAGSGKLCVDILSHLEIKSQLPAKYYILEVSGDLAARQKEYIINQIPHLYEKIEWLSTWPANQLNAVVIANEVLDAMPVHRFIKTEKGILEGYIGLDENSNLTELYQPCTNPALIEAVNAEALREFPYQSEVNLFIPGWFKQVSGILKGGVVLILDYGFPRHEYYHPDRSTGTLMCHYQHTSHTNPLAHPGQEDITAHVDFTAVAEAGFAAGLEVRGFVNQGSFLIMNNILQLLEERLDELTPAQQVKENQALKKLLQENEMGELFKVMALTKSYPESLQGFQLHDKRGSL
jgi:SAM-dependent MidA family methyltransferase